MKFILRLITRYSLVIFGLVIIYNVFFNTLFFKRLDVIENTIQYKTININVANETDYGTFSLPYFKYIKDGEVHIFDPEIEYATAIICTKDGSGCHGHNMNDIAQCIWRQVVKNDGKPIAIKDFKYKPDWCCNVMLVAYCLIIYFIGAMICTVSYNNSFCRWCCPYYDSCITDLETKESRLREKLIFLGYKKDIIDNYFVNWTYNSSMWSVRHFVETIKSNKT